MLRKIALLALSLFVLGGASAQDDPLKIGFIYVGPVGDYGWTYSHDLGRQKLVDHFGDRIETVYIESVPEAEAEPFIDQLIADGADVVFATSFGYGDAMLAAAERYPDVIFGHATGVQQAPNLLTYMADFYQVYYLNGLVAGALSDSNDLGYIAAFPIPEVKRHINGFAIGAREVNPDASVHVRWLYSWFDPAGAKVATEALMAEGADVFAFTEDTPTVIQTAAEQGHPSFSHYASMLEFSPTTVASGQLVNWEVLYIDIVGKILDGTYTTENLGDVDYFWLIEEGAVEPGAEPGMVINPAYEEELRAETVQHAEFGEISVYDLVFRRYEQMQEGRDVFDPFTGPMSNRNGELVIPEGETASIPDLLSLEWAAEGVVGPWDGE